MGFPENDGEWDFIWTGDNNVLLNRNNIITTSTSGISMSNIRTYVNPNNNSSNTNTISACYFGSGNTFNINNCNLLKWIQDYGGYTMQIIFVKTDTAANYHNLYDFWHTLPYDGWNFQYNGGKWDFGAGCLNTSGNWGSLSVSQVPVNTPLKFTAHYDYVNMKVRAKMEKMPKPSVSAAISASISSWSQSANGTSSVISATFKKSEGFSSLLEYSNNNQITMDFCLMPSSSTWLNNIDYVKVVVNRMLVDGVLKSLDPLVGIASTEEKSGGMLYIALPFYKVNMLANDILSHETFTYQMQVTTVGHGSLQSCQAIMFPQLSASSSDNGGILWEGEYDCTMPGGNSSLLGVNNLRIGNCVMYTGRHLGGIISSLKLSRGYKTNYF